MRKLIPLLSMCIVLGASAFAKSPDQTCYSNAKDIPSDLYRYLGSWEMDSTSSFSNPFGSYIFYSDYDTGEVGLIIRPWGNAIAEISKAKFCKNSAGGISVSLTKPTTGIEMAPINVELINDNQMVILQSNSTRFLRRIR